MGGIQNHIDIPIPPIVLMIKIEYTSMGGIVIHIGNIIPPIVPLNNINGNYPECRLMVRIGL